MVSEMICGPRRSYLDRDVHKTVYVGTCTEVRLIPSEKLKPHLKINDFSLLKSHVLLLLHLSWPQGSRQCCPSLGKVPLRKHSVMDKSQNQHLASFPVSSMSYSIGQMF